MIQADPSGREECCGAPKGYHWLDCPVWVFNKGYWQHRPEQEVQQ
jgi:hypothetical protein